MLIASHVFLGSNQFAVSRLRPDGLLDPSFGTSGHSLLDVTPGNDVAITMALDAIDRPLVAGSARIAGSAAAAVARFTQDGSVDVGFAGVGYVTRDVEPSRDDQVNAVEIDSSGRVVVGAMPYNTTAQGAMLRTS